MSKLISCTKMEVDCVCNDPVDVKAGGPQYLGFDFNVKSEDYEKLVVFVKDSLATFGIPLVSICRGGDLELAEEKVWNAERIINEISKDSDYLQREAQRNYTPQRKF